MSNNKRDRTFKEFLWEMLSEREYISSKRVAGMLMILTALGCTIYLAIKEGGSNTVEGLIQTAFIVGSSLLGLASVTSIWKGGRVMTSNIPEQEDIPKQKKEKYCDEQQQPPEDYNREENENDKNGEY